MLAKPIILTVDWCWRHARLVVLLFLLVCGGLGGWAVQHLSLDTDQAHLISPSLPYRVAEQAIDQAFPQNTDQLVVVIDADSSAKAEQAVTALAAALAPQQTLFRSVRRPPEELFYRRNGLLFLSAEDLTSLSDRLTAAQPILGSLAKDPSLRGLLGAIGLAMQGAAHGQADPAQLAPLMELLDHPAAAIAEGKNAAPADWSALVGGMAAMDKPQRILLTQPVLDFDDLAAAGGPSAAIRQAAKALGITPDHGMRVRLTGPVALADANFASVTEGTLINGPLMLLATVLLIYLAVRSLLILLSIMLALLAGLSLTMFFGVVAVGSFNPISIAFAVMFIGIAVDFAIQFVVRYRFEQQNHPAPLDAIRAAARESAAPLTLAAVATAVGFLSFVPTDYSGVSQLGLIAGFGMLVALLVDFTLLPALLALLPPAPLTGPIGLPWAAGDNFLRRACRPVVAVAAIVSLLGIALLPSLPLDFNPLHLQSTKSEAVSTFLELAEDPDNGVSAVDLLMAPAALAKVEPRCDAHPEILRCLSLNDFIPEKQDDKLAILADLAGLLGPTLSPDQTLPTPTPAELRQALLGLAQSLGDLPLASHLKAIAGQDDTAVLALQTALAGGVPELLGEIRQMLATRPITSADLPPDLKANWRSKDGQERLEVFPKGDMNQQTARRAFNQAVATVSDDAPVAGLPVNIEASGKVVVRAFIQAGLAALGAIFLLLWLLLRKIRDAALVLLPLVIGSLLTVIGCVLSGLAINFANIIALPLLLGIGVAFNIYFVINWRKGVTTPLQSPTTRAVLYSALTTGCAFGSLAASPHLGTASMGLLLFLSLGLSVLTTFLLLPALFALLKQPAA